MYTTELFSVNQKKFLKKQLNDKKLTYSGFKKSQVISSLIKEIRNNNIVNSCHRAVELHISNLILKSNFN